MEAIAIQLLFIFLIMLVGMLGIGAGIGLAICITNLLSSMGNLINSYIRKKKDAKMIEPDNCPVCGYKFEMCQCLFLGSSHPDRSKRTKVVSDHLYLLSPDQLAHFIKLQRYWHISYDDPEKMDILKELGGEAK